MKRLALALVAVCAAAEADAAVVSYTIGDGGLDFGFTATLDGVAANNGGSFGAGGIQITKTPGTGVGLPDSYRTLCTDIGGDIILGQSYDFSAPTPFSGQVGIAPPTWGFTAGFGVAAIQNVGQLFYTYGLGGVLSSGSSDQKAGLQLAIWEALYDTGNRNGLGVGGSSPASARFIIAGGNAAAYVYANAYLGGLTGNYNYQGYLLIPDPTSQHGNLAQELLIGVGDFTAAPEPTTYAAAASACAFLCILGTGWKHKRS